MESYYSSINLKHGSGPNLMVYAKDDSISSFNLLDAAKGIELGRKYVERYVPLIDRMPENY